MATSLKPSISAMFSFDS